MVGLSIGLRGEGGAWGERKVEWGVGRGVDHTYLVRVRSDRSVGPKVELDVAKHDLPRDAKARDEVLLLGGHGCSSRRYKF